MSQNKPSLSLKIDKYLQLYKQSYILSVKGLALLEIIKKLNFEEVKKEHEDFIDISVKFIKILWEEDKLKKEINFDSLSKNKINKINRVYKELKNDKEHFFNTIINIFPTTNNIEEIEEENKVSFEFKDLNTKIVFTNVEKKINQD
ncbi:hypothetical protein SKUN_001505 [Spiroplasma kunkelii CR2-3x]|uniref:Uncharacterized protein n=1 Tax=Spiroplasma kunkelii CR2-3x TaxID=273035 RepID=A0A0K2JIW0_SPIKU|nr:hypothetical protein [Spiroplasma kunkelii]ALA98363.1 hypothetical protein SKUN_001505 [Spiroplasma kunkelii CR2-3x]